MKFRTGFVTNSSSSSFIVILDPQLREDDSPGTRLLVNMFDRLIAGTKDSGWTDHTFYRMKDCYDESLVTALTNLGCDCDDALLGYYRGEDKLPENIEKDVDMRLEEEGVRNFAVQLIEAVKNNCEVYTVRGDRSDVAGELLQLIVDTKEESPIKVIQNWE